MPILTALPAGVDGGGPDQTREDGLIHDHLVVERPKEGNLRLTDDLDSEEPVLQRVDDNQHVAELGGNDTTPVMVTAHHYTAELGRSAHFRVFASPTRKHFDDAKREDAPPLKTTRSRKTRRWH